VLTAERNKQLTRVGTGTAMGNLLRRYWWPVAFTADLDGMGTKKVRLLGEDLVLFRDGKDRLGLLEEACQHRRASLVYGVCELDGLRCGYHGWLYDTQGRCLEQPGEPVDSTFKHRIRAKAYQAQEMGGLVWAYLGPKPAPLLPRYDVFVWEGMLRDIGHAMIPVNFLQIMENAVDPHHVEWLHGRFFSYLKERKGVINARTFAKRHLKIGFDVFEHGIIKRRLLEGETEEDDDWRIGHPLVFPHMLRVGGSGYYQAQIRVPVDDTHTWHVWYNCFRPDGVSVPTQERIQSYEVAWRDEKGEHIVDFIDGQDIMAWVTQGEVADRSREHLGKSDMGVILLRRLFLEQIAKVERGEDPLGVIRSEADNQVIVLPQEKNKFGAGVEFATEFVETGSVRYSPQKDLILSLYREAAGGKAVHAVQA
jgi:5,5'-dehydrodivanillate O-demethylase oxygenase subunit